MCQENYITLAEELMLGCGRFAKWRERRSRVEKDVRRTDRSQPFYRAEK